MIGFIRTGLQSAYRCKFRHFKRDKIIQYYLDVILLLTIESTHVLFVKFQHPGAPVGVIHSMAFVRIYDKLLGRVYKIVA